MSYIDYKISELCDVGSSKRIYKSDYQPTGIPFFRAKEISEKHKGIKDVSDPLFISEEKFIEISNKFGSPKNGDLLLTSIGALLGEPYVVNKDGDFYFKDGNLTWFRNFTNLHSKFLYYWLLSPEGRGELERCKIGSAQPAFTIERLRQMEIKLPSMAVQKSTVEILYHYDNLIENNNRRIAILEDMAQSLYREWFVNFRYPGHADAVDKDGNQKLIDSPLGQIPEDWDVKSLGELVDFKRKTIKKGNVAEQTPYMGLEHFPRRSIALSEWEEVSEIGSNKLVFTRGDILFGKIRPNFHKVGVAQVDGLCSSDTFVFSPKNVLHQALITMLTFSNEFVAQAVQTSQGSKMPRASWDVLKEFPVPIPSQNIIEKFNAIVNPAIEQIRVLSLKNRNLKKQRDMLLPKLISGQIEL